MAIFRSLMLACVAMISTAAWSAEAQTPPAAPAGPAGARFKEIYQNWTVELDKLRALREDYKAADARKKGEIRKQYNQLVSQAESQQGKVRQAAIEAYRESPNGDPAVSDLLLAIAYSELQADMYEEALEVARLLVENNASQKTAYNVAAVAAYNANDFAAAEGYLNKAREFKVANEEMEKEIPGLEFYKQAWARESAIREKEAKANDLPRVLLKTNKGDIELELLENEAPIAVANFISLVEKKFYDGLSFHRVLPGFMAQGGDPKGDGSGGPGYTIPCECYLPNHRLHFRGSLSMAHRGRDTGGSQFFMMFGPKHHLDGRHTVFGRVVKGMDVLAKIQRRDPQAPDAPQPDKIVEAKVLRKRNHPYEPKKLAE